MLHDDRPDLDIEQEQRQRQRQKQRQIERNTTLGDEYSDSVSYKRALARRSTPLATAGWRGGFDTSIPS